MREKANAIQIVSVRYKATPAPMLAASEQGKLGMASLSKPASQPPDHADDHHFTK
jgi:hypothetical protein